MRWNCRRRQPMLFVIGMPLLRLGPFLVGQAKTQFGHSRARLMPQFLAGPCNRAGWNLAIVVRAVSAAVAALLASCRAARGSGAGGRNRRAGHLGCALQSILAHVGLARRVLQLADDWGLDWWIVELIAACGDPRGRSLLPAFWSESPGCGGSSHLTEEMDDYQNVYQLDDGAAHRLRSGRAAPHRGVADCAATVRQQRRRLVARPNRRLLRRQPGRPRRAAALRLRGQSSRSAGPVLRADGVVPSAYSSASSACYRKSGATSAAAFSSSPSSAILMPGQMAGEMMAHAARELRPRCCCPSSRPAHRRPACRSARNAITLWVHGQRRAWRRRGDDRRATVAPDGCDVSAAVGINDAAAMGSACGRRFGRRWQSGLESSGSAWMVLFPPMMAWAVFREKIGDAPFLIIAIVFAGVGALAIYLARRAWLNLEFV